MMSSDVYKETGGEQQRRDENQYVVLQEEDLGYFAGLCIETIMMQKSSIFDESVVAVEHQLVWLNVRRKMAITSNS